MTEFLVVVVCLVINALLAAVEMAFVTIGKSELRQRARKGDINSKRLLAMRENPEKALSVIQIGISLVGAISAAVGGAGAEESLSPILEAQFGISENFAEGLSIVAVVVPLTYFSVVLGELVPKTIALRYPDRVMKVGVTFLQIGVRFLGPFVALLEGSTKTVLKIVLPKSAAIKSVEGEPSESKEAVDVSHLSTTHRQYIMNLANIESKRIRDVLLPWSQVESISQSSKFEELVFQVIQSGHTRLPVMNESSVVGMLHSKEFLAFASSGNRDWHTIIRSTVEVKASDNLLGTLRRLQDSKKHMGIVRDENGLIGVITLEDIIEEIIGDVFDEDDDGLVEKLLAKRSAALPRR